MSDQSGRSSSPTPPEWRRALKRLLCEDMPPGTDYESAVWGASKVLLIIREEAAPARTPPP